MAEYIYAACELLQKKYAGDARNIWSTSKSTCEVLDNLKAFTGIGKHKAIVGVFLLENALGISVRTDLVKLNIRTTCPSLYEIYGEGA
jgi:hypothetical protein